MQEKSIKKNVVLILLKNASTLIFPMLAFSYVARVLNPAGLGEVTFSKTITNYFVLFAMLGINLYGMREIAKVKDNKELRTKIAQEILCINLISSLISFCIFIIITFTVPLLVDKRRILLIFMLILLFKPLGLDWFFSGIEEYSYITKRTIFIQTLSFLALLLFVNTPEDAAKYAGVLVLSEIGTNIFNIVHVQKFIVHRKFKYLQVGHHIKPMLFLAGSVLSQQVYTDVDSLMLGIMTDDSTVGLYSAATKLSSAVTNLLIALCTVCSARETFYYTTDSSKAENLMIKTFNYLAMIALPVTVGLEVLGKESIIIFCGRQYLATVTTIQIIVPEIFFYAIVIFIQYMILNPMGKEKISFYITGIGALLNIVGNMILIPVWQEKGAAISTVFTKVSMLIIGIYYIEHFLKVSKALKYFWQYVIGSAVIVGLCLLIKVLFENVYVVCASCIVISAITYFGILMIMNNPYVNELLHSFVEKINNWHEN